MAQGSKRPARIIDSEAERTDNLAPTGTRTVERALDILATVALSDVYPTLREVAAAAGLPLSTTSRLLRTLEAEGFVTRSEDNRYWPGGRLLQIGAKAMGEWPLAAMAQGFLRTLAQVTGETAYLLVPGEAGQGVYIAQEQSTSSIRHVQWLGRTIDLEGTATGAALAGDLLPGGYALNRYAVEPDSATAAAPVLDARQRRIAVLSVIGPAFRIGERRLHQLGEAVAEQAALLSSRLGAGEPTTN